MFPLLLCCAIVYLMCVFFLRTAMANAPEAFEDEAGFHSIAHMGATIRIRSYLVLPI